MPTMTIGRLAQRAGVAVDTVRFYERRGLMPQATRTASGYRHYLEEDLGRLRFIRRAKDVGFTLEEIVELLSLGDSSGSRADVRRITDRRIRDLDQRIQELAAIRDALLAYAKGCSGEGPASGCPIIESLQGRERDSR